MVFSVSGVSRWSPTPMNFSEQVSTLNDYNLRPRGHVAVTSQETSSSSSGRRFFVFSSVSLVSNLAFSYGTTSMYSWAKDEEAKVEDDKDENIIGALKSLFDPNEKTKSGKVLPKDYLKSAREVVKTLRDSLNEDLNDVTKFRRTADAAKESIRGYLGTWRGQQTVVNEESYVIIEKAIRSLASFYSKAGPSASLPEEVRSDILNDLDTAEKFL